ncbi:hypothetical protein [Hoeflea sp. BAL378]|uniref:hypothetical protein n=1 Tax=Hoeflea sp. BAL378 TaxID=1547437 RepID=UPI00126A0F02|nr:hypothetical protein [Hoeflea sp. BAL378]
MIQPFDGGRYDKRFKDTFKPAIEEAGFHAYRVDKDPSVEIPIEDIEQRIRESEICLAEITEDNANVWYELGFAIASDKPVIMICSSERVKFPFDVQHRTIIKYKNESLSDFNDLKNRITEKLLHVSQRNKNRQKLQIDAVTKPRAGLADHEIAALVTIATEVDGSNDTLSVYRLKELLNKAGFTGLAGNLAIQKLLSVGLISSGIESGWNNNEEFEVCKPTEEGWTWVSDNVQSIELRTSSPPEPNADDDIPF